jgi:hypothetical protein
MWAQPCRPRVDESTIWLVPRSLGQTYTFMLQLRNAPVTVADASGAPARPSDALKAQLKTIRAPDPEPSRR